VSLTNRGTELSLLTRIAGYAAGLAAVVLVSLAIGFVLGQTHIANISMLYLIAILVTAVVFGSGPAVVASVASFLIFNWFFVEPLHTFTVADPTEWIALLLFLATAVITGQLAASQMRRADEAKQREREAVVLYDVARLVTEDDLRAALVSIADRLRNELQVSGVAIDLIEATGFGGTAVSGDMRLAPGTTAVSTAPTQLLREGSAPTGAQRSGTGRWVAVVPPHATGRARSSSDRYFVVPVTSDERRVGTITLVRDPLGPQLGTSQSRVLSAVAAQLGQAVERERLRRDALESEVLRRSDELKSALLNAVSHDLRTPLASIVASAGSLRQDDVTWTPEDRREFVATIEQEANRLNAIIENLLDLSRMESGILQPRKEWYDLAALVDDVLGRLRPLTNGHPVVVDIPSDLPPVELDYVEIDQVLSNLIENATKYVPTGQEIRVSARRSGGELQVEVTDRGPGVSQDALRRLFEPFYREDEARRKKKGSGLGLAVSKGLVEAHGGRIWAENRPGGGARFVFTLPAPDPAPEKPTE
jgi:two-component system sensor histidine kinase KdpD